jgi:hypothetical protein
VAVERGHPVLLDLGDDRAPARRQLFGHLVEKFEIDPDVEGVAPAARQRPPAAPTAATAGPPSSPIKPPSTVPSAAPAGRLPYFPSRIRCRRHP